jgi:trehalose-6-phosphatase
MLQTDPLIAAWRNSAVSKVPPAELVMVTDFDGTLAHIVPDPTQSAAMRFKR